MESKTGGISDKERKIIQGLKKALYNPKAIYSSFCASLSTNGDLLDLFVSSFEQWKYIMFDEWAYTVSIIAKSFKDRSYSEEQESRLVCAYYGDSNAASVQSYIHIKSVYSSVAVQPLSLHYDLIKPIAFSFLSDGRKISSDTNWLIRP